jgi:hypothetical protein
MSGLGATVDTFHGTTGSCIDCMACSYRRARAWRGSSVFLRILTKLDEARRRLVNHSVFIAFLSIVPRRHHLAGCGISSGWLANHQGCEYASSIVSVLTTECFPRFILGHKELFMRIMACATQVMMNPCWDAAGTCLCVSRIILSVTTHAACLRCCAHSGVQQAIKKT